MECRGFRFVFTLRFEQSGDTFLHFLCRLVGERHGEDSVRFDSVTNKVGDSERDDARFPGSGTGQDEQRSPKRVHGV